MFRLSVLMWCCASHQYAHLLEKAGQSSDPTPPLHPKQTHTHAWWSSHLINIPPLAVAVCWLAAHRRLTHWTVAAVPLTSLADICFNPPPASPWVGEGWAVRVDVTRLRPRVEVGVPAIKMDHRKQLDAAPCQPSRAWIFNANTYSRGKKFPPLHAFVMCCFALKNQSKASKCCLFLVQSPRCGSVVFFRCL